jgi:hypothetical protein
MAVTTAVFREASAESRQPQIRQGLRTEKSGAPRSDGKAGVRGCAAAGSGAVQSESADAILLRERLRSQQILSARPLAVVRRTVGPADCPRSAPARAYRLGRWERLAMTLVVTAAVAVVGLTSLSPSSPTRDTVVLPGDTMLSIALREMPDVDPARAAELIGAANGSTDVQIVPGMTLAIPAER